MKSLRPYLVAPFLAFGIGVGGAEILSRTVPEQESGKGILTIQLSPEEYRSLTARPEQFPIPVPIPIPPQEPSPEPGYDYSHPRIQHFYDLFTGEQSRDIQTRIERTQEYGELIREAAHSHNIPSETLFALIVTESGGNPNARSSAGARGLTQIMPGTARGRGCNNLTDPETSINCGAAYLAELKERFGSLDMALAAFNIGPTRTRRIMEGSGSGNYWDNFDQGEYVPKIRAVELIINQ